MIDSVVANTVGFSPILLKPAKALEKSIVFGFAKTLPPANDDKWVVRHTVKFCVVSWVIYKNNSLLNN